MNHSFIDANQRDLLDTFPPLTHLFNMPLDKHGKRAIYLNGNSLGPMPKNVNEALHKECKAWSELGVRGHFDKDNPWFSFHEGVTQSLARLIGAKPCEIIAMGTLTTNLHLAFISFYQPTKDRYKIIRLSGFPSDTYAIASQVKQRLETISHFNGVDSSDFQDAIIEVKANEQGLIDLSTFAEVIKKHGEQTSVIWIEAVHFLTGQFFDIPEITRMAHQYGCKMGLDLAHAIGNVPLQLHEWDLDFAVWCSYKYLSGGPGAIAGMYVHEKYSSDPNILKLSGWWGNNKATRFNMLDTFDPIPTAESWQLSNPGIFLLATLRQALDIFDSVDLLQLREKNIRLVAYLEALLHQEIGNFVSIITPNKAHERGCQLSLKIKGLNLLSQIEELFYDEGIFCDVRGDLVRVAPMGLYSTHTDIFYFVEKLKKICLQLNHI